MSVDITIKNAIKIYGTNKVIDGLSLDIKKGELFTLLGPSGCGKTTLLRMIAGFNSIEGGSFYFGDNLVNDLDPAKRNIGMVFQNYAIFPHMTVYNNVAFGLKNQTNNKEEIQSRTLKMLELMQIEDLKDRMPEKLSGGQQQRVALARAIVIEPKVLLMDEPLSNLDAKLRVDMRSVIREIQKQVGITTVYVTHDQEEAMSISDRIAVMNKGVIQQIGTPKEIYLNPTNIFVSTFIGKTNIVHGKMKNGSLYLGDTNYKLSLKTDDMKSQKVKYSIRPEDMRIESNNHQGINGTVVSSSFLGIHTHYSISIDGVGLVEVIDESNMDVTYNDGEKVSLKIKVDKINIFKENGEENITKMFIEER